ncbi:MAG: hypothetical protein HY319_07270 [Armatimonadetes bacterium]|nr:hypothetical protein [Armatimonadota bacterium]
MTRDVRPGTEAAAYFAELMKDRPIRLAVAGYSRAPESYEQGSRNFLHGLARSLQGLVGFITSPTDTPGSIDRSTVQAAGRAGAPLALITAVDYLGEAGTPQQPIFVYPTPEDYSRATAEHSNALLVLGGRTASIDDFLHAIERHHRVVIVIDAAVAKPPWEGGRVEDASRYLKQMWERNYDAIPLDDVYNARMLGLLESRREKLGSLLRIVEASDPGAVSEAAEFLRPGAP